MRADDEEEFEDGWTSYNEQAVGFCPEIQAKSGSLKRPTPMQRYLALGWRLGGYGVGKARGARGSA